MDRHHKRHKRNVALNLVSLMDIFTILVFFLLVNSSEVQTLPNARDLELPESATLGDSFCHSGTEWQVMATRTGDRVLIARPIPA